MILARIYKKSYTFSLSNQILKFGAFIYFIDRTAEGIRYVLALEVEYLGIVMKAELSITDTVVVSAVKCRRMKTRRGRKC